MAINLSLDKRTDQVFSSYEEKFVGNSIVLEGCLLPHNQEARDAQVIRFISGGRRYLDYELERDGAYVKGVIRYRPMPLPNPGSIEACISKIEAAICKAPRKNYLKRAVSDSQIDKIRLLHAKGRTYKDIAIDMGIHSVTVAKVVKRKGSYAE